MTMDQFRSDWVNWYPPSNNDWRQQQRDKDSNIVRCHWCWAALEPRSVNKCPYCGQYFARACKYHLRRNGCKHGVACKFKHLDPVGSKITVEKPEDAPSQTLVTEVNRDTKVTLEHVVTCRSSWVIPLPHVMMLQNKNFEFPNRLIPNEAQAAELFQELANSIAYQQMAARFVPF